MFCIPIIASDTQKALEKIDRATPFADMLEIRLDMMNSFDLHQIIQTSQKPTLVTYRSEKEGGRGRADPKSHTDYLLSAIHEGADLVDVELSLSQKWRDKIFNAKGGSGIVISTHRDNGTPSQDDLEKILRDSIDTGAHIVKIVTRAETYEDNLRVLQLIPKAHAMGVKIVAFCMGPMGRISRIFSHLMGSYLTFVSLEAGEESAAGQIPINEMKKILEMLSS
jgi:3-dehydroquinate dehydratase type I